MAIALFQGAALQYLGCSYGVNDFDVHFFYAQNPRKPRLSQTIKRIYASVASFPSVPVDLIRTVVPDAEPSASMDQAIRHVQLFLRNQPTANALHLSRKAVVGLRPHEIFGQTVWPAA